METDTAKVVIIDDEPMVLQSLSSFLMLETDYDIETFDSPAAALEAAKSNPVDLIMTDYLMPGMNGIELLLAMKKIHPYATRVLLTGYADKENAIKAINKVGLYQYIEKPWDNEALRLTIENGLERRFLIQRLEEKMLEVEGVRQNLQDIQAQIIKAFI